ncbi:FAD binding domain-containing protein, partial [Helicosporidium sp. ATCC 50920]
MLSARALHVFPAAAQRCSFPEPFYFLKARRDAASILRLSLWWSASSSSLPPARVSVSRPAMDSAMPPSLGAVALALLVAVVVSVILLRRKGSGAVSLASPAAVAGVSQGLAVAPAPTPPQGSRVLIVFATQTGTAERFAKSLRSELESRFGGGEVSFEVAPVEKVSTRGLRSEKCVILLMATYGDGEPTDDAVDFHESLLTASRAPDAPSSLRGLSHAVFALGNRQYEHFCAVGLQAHAALARLGSAALLEAGTGDDDADIDEDFERWTASLTTALQGREDLVGAAGADPEGMGRSPSGLGARAALQEPGSLEVEVLAPSHERYGEADGWRQGRGCSAQDTVGARVLCVRELHSPLSQRSCVHVELDLGDSPATYCAGDHAGVLPANSPELVARAAARLGYDLSQVVLLRVPDSDRSGLAAPSAAPLSVRQLLAQFVDLCGSPGKSALAALAWTASDEDERVCLQSMATSSPEGRALFHERVVEPKASLLDLLEAFP